MLCKACSVQELAPFAIDYTYLAAEAPRLMHSAAGYCLMLCGPLLQNCVICLSSLQSCILSEMRHCSLFLLNMR
jgi:hypothetical protein